MDAHCWPIAIAAIESLRASCWLQNLLQGCSGNAFAFRRQWSVAAPETLTLSRHDHCKSLTVKANGSGLNDCLPKCNILACYCKSIVCCKIAFPNDKFCCRNISRPHFSDIVDNIECTVDKSMYFRSITENNVRLTCIEKQYVHLLTYFSISREP